MGRWTPRYERAIRASRPAVDDERGQSMQEALTAIATRSAVALPQLRVLPNHPMIASTEPAPDGSALVLFDPCVLSAPTVVRDTVIAHELAHAALGHASGSWSDRLVRRNGVVGIACFTGAFVVLADGVRQLVTIGPTPLSFLAAYAAMALVLVAICLTSRRLRRLELAADARAAAWGYPYSPVIVSWERSIGRTPTPSWQRWWSTHPSWDERLQAARAT